MSRLLPNGDPRYRHRYGFHSARCRETCRGANCRRGALTDRSGWPRHDPSALRPSNRQRSLPPIALLDPSRRVYPVRRGAELRSRKRANWLLASLDRPPSSCVEGSRCPRAAPSAALVCWLMSRPPAARCSPATAHQAVLARRAASLSASGQRQAQPRSCLSRRRGGVADEIPVLPDTMTTRSSRFVTRATEPVVNAALPVTGCRSAMLDRSATSNATRYPSQPPRRGRPATAVARARCQLTALPRASVRPSPAREAAPLVPLSALGARLVRGTRSRSLLRPAP
jgi:hypothetical protein